MGKKLNKSGQFYLIGALIIIVALTSIFSIVNYSKKEQNIQIENSKKELQIETRYLTDYIMHGRYSQEQKHNILTSFSRNYSTYIGKDKSVYFVFGNRSNASVSGYQNEEQIVILSSNSSRAEVTRTEGDFSGSINPGSDRINLSISSVLYNFNLSENFNFYFVVSDKKEGNEYFISG
mgnify:FL=1